MTAHSLQHVLLTVHTRSLESAAAAHLAELRRELQGLLELSDEELMRRAELVPTVVGSAEDEAFFKILSEEREAKNAKLWAAARDKPTAAAA